MKIVILTSDWYLSAKVALKNLLESPLLKKHDIQIVSILSVSNFELDKRTYKRTLNFIKKSGFKFFLKYTLINIWQNSMVKLAKYFVPNRKREYFDIEELADLHGIQYKAVADVNSLQTQEIIKQSSPDYLVSCLLLQILKKEVLDIPKKGGINFHPALTQKHRGVFSAFWALLSNFKKTGATVHFMTEKVDEGNVIIQKRFFIHPTDTINSVNEKNAKLGGELLVRALVKLKRTEEKGFLLKKLGKIFTIPSLENVQQFERKSKKLIKGIDFLRI